MNALLNCQPAPHAAPIGAGAVHGTNEIALPIRSELAANHATVAFTIGATMNGTNRIGFITIGLPKITGSLMLNMAGTIPSLPIERR